jgi:hypothetical protein
MGWGTDFNVDLFLSKEQYSNLGTLEEAIESEELFKTSLEKQILMWASSNVKDIIPKEWKDEPITFINNNVGELLQNYDETCIHIYNLLLYKKSLNKKEE